MTALQSHCLRTEAACISDSAEAVYALVCRTVLFAPGFCLVDLGRDCDSIALRHAMVQLKEALDDIHRIQSTNSLVYLSAARFDQQVSTKFHRDGGPDECFLMLGYEPSDIPAEISLADYSRCAFDRGMTPAEFLERHNPMFKAGEQLLDPYITRLDCFHHDHANIVIINNSMAPFSLVNPSWQGVLHTAFIPHPDESRRRIINSTMIASVPPGTAESVTAGELGDFQSTSLVRRHGYDKPHLDDDA